METARAHDDHALDGQPGRGIIPAMPRRPCRVAALAAFFLVLWLPAQPVLAATPGCAQLDGPHPACDVAECEAATPNGCASLCPCSPALPAQGTAAGADPPRDSPSLREDAKAGWRVVPELRPPRLRSVA